MLKAISPYDTETVQESSSELSGHTSHGTHSKANVTKAQSIRNPVSGLLE